MKKIFTLTLLLIAIGFTGSAKVWTITAGSGALSYTPATQTIALGDSVNFSLDFSHDALEISQSTWNSNGTTPLAGGFAEPNGGGLVTPAKLAVGTHYYICQPHASFGMKGRIIVTSGTAGIPEHQLQATAAVYPNPFSGGKLQLTVGNELVGGNATVYDICGKIVSQSRIESLQSEMELNIPTGLYLLYIVKNDVRVSTKIIKE